MRILMPALFEQAVVQIGSRPAIALPMGQLAEFAPREEEAVAQQDGAADPRAGSTMPTFKITTRREATALLEQVGAYYRTVEPSSPIPHLTIARGRSSTAIFSHF
jgi:type VI secretion system protein ImpA